MFANALATPLYSLFHNIRDSFDYVSDSNGIGAASVLHSGWEASSMKQIQMRLLVFNLLAAAGLIGSGQDVDFNRQIRPILSDKCYTCHGPDAANRKTKLRFDLEELAKAPLLNGKVSISAGHPEQSELLSRVTSPNRNLRMPPAYMGKDALNPREIELLTSWIAQGAKWEPFWSFVPPKRPPPPAVGDAKWVRNPIDSFILHRLEREGLRPSVEADRPTLIRRVSLDLTGIPPTPEEVEAFVRDESSNAYGKVVDRMLASPRYAERMAFRWMEAARYGDTNGYQTDGPRDMWRWRDWVIEAYNRNIPYDRFLIEQLAGDLLPNADTSQKIASGFNRNHRTTGEGGIIPEEYRVEYVADRVQTTSTVFLGLTIGCARCHDHKYDPITQKEFYSLFSYFNQVPDEKGFVWNYGNEEPFVKAPLADQQTVLAELDRNLEKSKKAWDFQAPRLHEARRMWEQSLAASDWTVTRSLVFSHLQDTVYDGKEFFEQKDGSAVDFDYLQPFTYSAWIKPDANKPESITGGILSHSDDYMEGSGHGIYLVDGHIRFHLIHRWTDLGIREQTKAVVKPGEWQQITVTYDGRRKASGLLIYLNGIRQDTDVLFDQNNEPLHVPNRPIRVGAAGGMRFQGTIRDAFIFKDALTPDEVQAMSATESIAAIAKTPEARRTSAQEKKLELAFLESAAPQQFRDAQAQWLNAAHERQMFYDSIPTVMVMRDGANRDTFLLKRGAYDSPGEKVTSGTPAILGGFDPHWPNNRLGFAQWLADRRNPLTARVAVNRLWQSFFGFGIVKTVDDFGSQGEWPVHPELLDWLAVEFMDSGWDLKKIQKQIVTSAAYRQTSKTNPELVQRDPDNRLLARGPRYRLGPEEIRDQALAVSGLLVEKLGGPSVMPYQPPGLWQELSGGKGYVQEKGEGLYRRSLYTYWKRTVAPPYMINFDSPNREMCAVWENRTNSPLQALNLMNDVEFLEASRKVAERILTSGGTSTNQRIDYAFRLALAKYPKPEQRQIFEKTIAGFLSNFRDDPKAAALFLHQGESPVRMGLDVPELAAWTAVSSILLNLDEVINKQ